MAPFKSTDKAMQLKCTKIANGNIDKFFSYYAGQIGVLYSFLTKGPASSPEELKSAAQTKLRAGHEMYFVYDMSMNNILVGTITLIPVPRLYCGGRTDVLLEDLVVNPAYRSKGVGEQLVNIVKRRASAAGWRVLLRCGTELKSYYEKFGFEDAGLYMLNKDPSK